MFLNPSAPASLGALADIVAKFLAGSGVDLYTIGKLLGLVNVASTARDAQLANDTLLAAAEVGATTLNVNWKQ